MRFTIFAFIFTLLSVSLHAQALKSISFKGGMWFNGEEFVEDNFYSVEGLLTKKRPISIDTIIDLSGKFIIPPFGDAHSHNFGGTFKFQNDLKEHINNGVFYVRVLNNSKRGAESVISSIMKPKTMDVTFAHGGLTSNYSHPIEVYESLALGYYSYDQQKKHASIIWESRRMEGDSYYVIESLDDLRAKWDRILSGEPDVLKVFLRNSEVYEERRDFRPSEIRRYDGGVSPVLIPEIVRMARSEGLPVAASSNSSYDFQIAVEAGVDQITHFPCNQVIDADEQCMILTAIAQEAARKEIEVTLIVNEFYKGERTADVEKILLENIQTLKKHDVSFSIGSNQYGKTINEGIVALSKTKTFSNLELLTISTTETSRQIFPNRKIGKLKEGYEASFLVLTGNPISDFRNIESIDLIVKEGYVLF